MTDHIHFILTGGTIEKAYDPVTEKPEFKNMSVIPDYLAAIVKIYPKVSYETVCQIDSLNMTDDVRASILDSVERAQAQKIIIVHGTSTMDITARYLVQNLKGRDKTIVLTGAMIPLKEFAMSDAGFNLGYAVAQVSAQQAGVYVCMNARTFAAQDVMKNTQEGRFEAV